MSERLRIAVLSRNFSVTGGGAERYSIELVEQLAERHEVHVFAQSIEHEFPGVTYHQVPLPMQRPRWINQLYFAWKTWRATRSGFDIVHSHENTWHGNVQTVHVLPVKYTLFANKQGAALALRWLKVLTSPRLLAYLWLESRRLRLGKAKIIAVTSPMLNTCVTHSYPNLAKNLKIVTPGIRTVHSLATDDEKTAARRSLGLPNDVPIALFVGNDMRKKGLPLLIAALREIPYLNVAVVGDGSHMFEMKNLAKIKGVSDRIHFLGKMHDVGLAYASADLMVHPTQEDTYAMVVLEAMSHGLPVIVSGSKYCGISTELTDRKNSILLENPLDSGRLFAAIREILSDGGFYQELSSNGLIFAKSQTWSYAAKMYEGFMNEVL